MPGIDIVTDGEQFRIHFVHGFLERIEGIDWAQEDQDGHPQQPLRRRGADGDRAGRGGKGSVHGDEARFARAHTEQQAQVHPARPDDDLRHHRRRALRPARRHGDGVRRRC